jgi:hypothetical protein
VTGVQRGLLRRAVQQVRPGGTLLYATCTAAPEENEGIVSWALRRLPVSLEEIPLDVPHEPGLTSHGGVSFPAEVRHTWRLNADHVTSGCLFMARFRREARRGETSIEDEGWSAPPWSFSPPQDGGEPSRRSIELALDKLHLDMGVPRAALERFRWMARGGSVWLHTCDQWPLAGWRSRAAPERDGSTLVSFGLRAFRIESGGRLRPTNDLFRLLDEALQERVITLDRGACARLLEAGETEVGGTLDGYVALRLEDHVIGRGWVRGGRLRSEVPRSHARLLAEALRVSGGRALQAVD